MKKWFKRGLFAVVTLLIVALVGGAVFLLTFDPNAYKQRLEQWVYERYQRTLSIEGDIKLSLFPRIGLEVEQVSLSDQQSPQRFASINSARVAVAVWPLLWNHLVVDHVAVNGFKIWLRRDEEGGSNFTDLLHRSILFSTPSVPEAGQGSVLSPDTDQTVFQIDIAGLELKEGEIHFSDEPSQTQLHLVDLDINTGRVTFGQPFDVIFKGQLKGKKADSKATITGQSVLQMEPYYRRYSALRTNVSLVGQWEHQAWQIDNADLRLTAAELAWQQSTGNLQAKKLKLRAQAQVAGRVAPFEGAGDIDLSLSTGSNTTTLSADALDGTMQLRLAQGRLLGWDIPAQIIDGEAESEVVYRSSERYTVFEQLRMNAALSQGQARLSQFLLKAPRFNLQKQPKASDAFINLIDEQVNIPLQGQWYPVGNFNYDQPFELLLSGPWQQVELRARLQ